MKLKLFIILLLTLGFVFKDWISLGLQAWGYPTTVAGQPANLVHQGSYIYGSLAEGGLGIYEVATQRQLATLPPPQGSESIDDIAVAGGFLFTLDARIPGYLSVFSLANPLQPRLVSGPLLSDVGPFSGVSAAGGKVVVSGGTSLLTLRKYDAKGNLASDKITADLGRGQPDILLSPDGKRGVVSSHFSGPSFGLTTLDISSPFPALTKAGSLELKGAGFSEGGAQPANFPIEGAWAGDKLLLAHGGGVAFIDLQHLRAPRIERILDVGVLPVNVDALGSLAVVVGSSPRPRLVLIDIGSWEFPKILRTLELPPGSMVTGVALTPTHVAVADQNSGVLFFQR